MKRCLLALCVAFISVRAARADIALPEHLKYADPLVAFEGVGDHKDYVFYLRYLTFNGAPGDTPHTVVEVRDAKPFLLKLERRFSDMQLLSMKRSDFARQSKGQKSLAWLSDKTDGVLAADIEELPTTVVLKTAKKPPQATYRVHLKNGKLEVEVVSRTKSPPEANAGGTLPNSMAGLALAAGLASLGMLFVRRRNAGRPIADR